MRKCSGALAWSSTPFVLSIVGQPSIVGLVPPSVCAGAAFNVNLGLSFGTGFTSVTWDFGDGTPSVTSTSATSAIHQYNDPLLANANYTITATVVDAGGCPGVVTQQYPTTVLPSPIITLSPPTSLNLCGTNNNNLPEYLASVNLQSGFGSGVTVQWFKQVIGGPTTAVGPPNSPTINVGTYGPGSYYATVTNPNGCSKNTPLFSITCLPTCNGVVCSSTNFVNANTVCQQVTVNLATTACGAAPLYWVSNVSAPAIIDTNSPSLFQAHNVPPGQYRIYPVFPCPTVVNGVIIGASTSFVIPYRAALKYNVTCVGNGYNVQLLDSSEVYPFTPIQQFSFTVDGGTNWYAGTLVNNIQQYSINLPANTTRQIGIRIQRAGYAACTEMLTLALPPLPVATFTYVNNCKNDVVLFTPTVLSPGLQYYWTVNGTIFNTQATPGFVFQPLSNTVTLTVSNRFGCSVTSAPVQVNVVEAKAFGALSALPSFPCEGSPVNILFTKGGGQFEPVNFLWYRNLPTPVPFAQTTVGNLTVNQQGLYFVTTQSANGCREFYNEPVNVNYQPTPPAPVVSGARTVCAENVVNISVPTNAAYNYEWRRDGVLITPATNDSVAEQLPPGTYVYSVIAQSASVGTPGIFCNSPATNYTVTVLPIVIPAELEIRMITCDPYRYRVTVTNPQPNTVYYWSNGVVGNQTFYTHDGPVAVTARIGACEVISRINLPSDFGSISWSFPTGCYQFCRQIPVGSITNPTGSYDSWNWLQNGSPILSGSGYIAPLNNIDFGSSYSLQLNQGQCSTLLGPATIDVDRNCLTRCDFAFKPFEPDCNVLNNTRVYTGNLGMAVGFASGSITLSVPNGEGYFTPSAHVVQNGWNTLPLVFVPIAPFNGGIVEIGVTGYNVNGEKCFELINGMFPRCRPLREAPQTDENQISYDDLLIVAPNPTKGETTISYQFAQEQSNKNITVSDSLGRILWQKNITDLSGNFMLDCSRYGTGIYYIAMKSDDKVIKQVRLEKD